MFSREPIVLVNAITAVVVAGIAAFINAGGAVVDPDTQKQLTLLVTAIGYLLASFIGRSKVTPTSDPRDVNGKSLN